MTNPFKGTGRRRSADPEGLGGPNDPPPPKSVQALAALALFLVALGTVASIAYAAIVKHDQSSTALLGTLATASVSALVVLAGGRHGGDQ